MVVKEPESANSAREYVVAIRELLKDHENQKRFYDYILENGKAFDAPPIPKRLPKGIDPGRYKVGECFYNAQVIAMKRGFHYYEGFATALIPTAHAWVTTPYGELMDLTWGKIKALPTYHYFGVEIPADFYLGEMLKTGISTGMLHKYWRKQSGDE